MKQAQYSGPTNVRRHRKKQSRLGDLERRICASFALIYSISILICEIVYGLQYTADDPKQRDMGSAACCSVHPCRTDVAVCYENLSLSDVWKQ
jgi:hypothetical protein